MKHCHITAVLLLGYLTGCSGSGTENIAASEVSSAPFETELQPISISSGPPSITYDAFAEINFDSTDADYYQCKLNDQDIVNCESPLLLIGLEVGEQSLSIKGFNNSNSATTETQLEWEIVSVFSSTDAESHHSDVVPTNVVPSPTADNSWRGIFRINCDFSHSSYDDPIVYFGEGDGAHLHRFYGNLLTDENSDILQLFTTGESSCQGNTLNRSAYWTPALLAPQYTADGSRALDENGQPAWQVVPAVVGNDDVAHEIFYYSAGVDDLNAIQPIPLGLKMIAGNSKTMPGMEQDSAIVRWHCQSWGSSDAQNPRWSASIPECEAPDRVRMDIFFPSCWDGVNLDSDDHQSHLAYPADQGGQLGMACPESHPVPIIRVSFHYAFGVTPEVYDPATKSSAGWRLASDMYEVSENSPGGLSLHADWFNAWQPEILQTIIDICIQGQLDCHDGNMGNGFRLSGTQPGTQFEPPIVNRGMGY
ncbi:DUF1996 domain-containing protein [Alteromonas facilis]|uniref:DUF1996 domain-containing protein n=1 Tax=Alteromonas facilis TaxID=2048004 RepID=UPI000C28AB73|nr:DUF1996 domain-containing protein [Alteromonas facilis]